MCTFFIPSKSYDCEWLTFAVIEVDSARAGCAGACRTLDTVGRVQAGLVPAHSTWDTVRVTRIAMSARRTSP